MNTNVIMNTNVFDENFINTLKTTLNIELADKKTIARKDLCKTLHIPESYQDIVSFVISNDVLPGFEIIPGRFGGIAKEGTKGSGKRDKKPREPKVKLTNEFVAALKETLAELCADGSKHFRSAIAEAMGTPDTETKRLISDAFNANLLPEYEIVRGRFGGIKLRDKSDTEDSVVVGSEETIAANNDDIADGEQELIVADDDDNAIDLSDYNLDDLSDEVRAALMRQEKNIQTPNNVTSI